MPLVYRFQYLHQGPNEHNWWLDHRLTPDCRAMLVAMTSRNPVGGLRARYCQLLVRVALHEHRVTDPSAKRVRELTDAFMINVPHAVDFVRSVSAEDILCRYPLHPVVQQFFEKWVGQYGHSSVVELSGNPAFYVDGISWFTAWNLFDSRLVCGQENSTRAVSRRDWPLCREAKGNPDILENDRRWSEMFVAELDAWKDRFKDPEERRRYGVADKEPFRPALDHARWALSGAKSTGVAFASHLRERARALRQLDALARASRCKVTAQIAEEARQTVVAAVPGLGSQVLSSVSGAELPAHMAAWFGELPYVLPDKDAKARLWLELYEFPSTGFGELEGRTAPRTYLDPSYNHLASADLAIRCSLAVARDWHRHRPELPWWMILVMEAGRRFRIHPAYEPLTALAERELDALIEFSSDLFRFLQEEGHLTEAMLVLPFGTEVELSARAGLTDLVYMLELRAFTHGANFEYREQANDLLEQLIEQLEQEEPGLPDRLMLTHA